MTHLQQTMKKILLLTAMLIPLAAAPQDFKLTMKFSHYKPQKVRLTHFYEDKQYLDIDSAQQNGNTVWFEGEGELYPGIYSIILADEGTSFEVLADHDNQFMTFKADVKDIQKTMKVTGSEINAKFFEYQRTMTDFNRKRANLDTLRRHALDTAGGRRPDSTKAAGYQEQIEQIDKQTKDFTSKTISDNKGNFLGDMLDCMNASDLPLTEMYDHINFAQKGLIRTPFLVKALFKHIARTIDDGQYEIIRRNDMLIEKTKADNDMFHYVSGYLLNFYRTFFKGGMNEVFVHLADKYFLSAPEDELSSESRSMIQHQRDIFASSMVGSKAHPIRMRRTIEGDSIDVLDAHDGTIFLLFWSNGCGHCDSAEKSLMDVYDGLQKNNIRVISVNNDQHSFETLRANAVKKDFPWTDVCDTEDSNSRYREYYYVVSTPIMYIIDTNKRIVQKCVGEDQIDEIARRMSE